MTYISRRLTQFFGAYLHQDWLEEYNSVEEAIEDYCSCGDLGDRLSTVSELEELISLSKKGELLEKDLLKSFSCYYVPSKHGFLLDQWLSHVKDTMKNVLQKRGNGGLL